MKITPWMMELIWAAQMEAQRNHTMGNHRVGPGRRTILNNRRGRSRCVIKPYGVRTKGYAPHGNGRFRVKI